MPKTLFSTTDLSDVDPCNAAETTVRKRGPVARRRFQKGCFVTDNAGRMYSIFYADVDGKTKQVRKYFGNSKEMREHAAKELGRYRRCFSGKTLQAGALAKGPRGSPHCSLEKPATPITPARGD
jgi:hypothetical protein